VDLARRIALSIAFCSSFLFASQNDEEAFGDDIVELLARIALREEAKLAGRYAATDIEDPIRCNATHSDPAVRATAASDLLCPEDVQLLLIEDSDESVVAALATNPVCAQKVFAGFQARLNGTGLEWEISAALLANPACPTSLLGKLVADYLDPEACEIVAGNPSCSPEMLADICWYCGSSSPATAVARRNPIYSEAEFRNLIEKRLNEGAIVRNFVAERDDTPADILTRLAYDERFSVQRYVASNSATPESVLLLLSRQDVYSDDNDAICEDLDDDDPDLGPEHVREAALCNPSNPLYQAQNADTSSDRLGGLACHHSVEVRRLAAANPNASSNAIDKLALDSDEGARKEAAANDVATAATLVKLANDLSASVRAAVAANSSCPKPLFKIFALDKAGEVRMAAGLNPNCTSFGLETLASSQFYEYRALAASHRNCTGKLFKQLAADPEKVVRIAVVNNIHCPIEIRAPLFMVEGSGLDESSIESCFDEAEHPDDVDE
jgi:hypothetical protein